MRWGAGVSVAFILLLLDVSWPLVFVIVFISDIIFKTPESTYFDKYNPAKNKEE